MAENCELNLFATNTRGEMLTDTGVVTTNPEEAAVSNLYTDLMNINKDRSWVISMWSLAHDSTFLKQFGSSLEYDSRGEVIATSLLNILQDNDLMDSNLTKKFVESREKQFNETLAKQPDPKQQLKAAIELATAFNTNPDQGISGFSALIEYKNPSRPSEGYRISITAKSKHNSDKFNRFMKHQNLLSKIQYRLAQLGLRTGFLELDSNSVYVKDLNAAEYAHTGLLTMINISASTTDVNNYTEDVLMQTAKLLLDIIRHEDNSLRYDTLLKSVRKEDFIEYYKDTYSDAMLNNPVRRKEVAAYILAKSLKEDTGRNFFTRIVNWAKHLFKKLNPNSVIKDRDLAYIHAEKIAREFLSGKFEGALNIDNYFIQNTSIYSQNEIIGTPHITGRITETYQAIVNNIRSLVQDMYELNPATRHHYETLLKSVEADISVIEESKYADMLAVQNIVDTCRRLYDEFPAFWEKLSKLDFEHQGTPVEEVEKYQTLREITKFIDYVREIQALIDETIKDRDLSTETSKLFLQSMLAARKLLNNFLTSNNIQNLSLSEICERKQIQCVSRFMENIYGSEYIEMATRTVREGNRLVTKKARYIYFDRRKAENKKALIEDIIRMMEKSTNKVSISTENYNALPPEGKLLWDNVISKKEGSERKLFLQEEYAKIDEGMKSPLTEVIDKDLNWYNTYMESMSNNPDIMGQILDKAVKEANSWANDANIHDRNYLLELSKEWKKISNKRTTVLYEKNTNGDSDGYFVSRYNTGKWAKDYDDFLKQATLEFYEMYPMYKPKQDIFGDDLPIPIAARLQYQTFINKRKAKWHREHSHYDEQLQQYRPGKRVLSETPDNVDRITGTFGDVVSKEDVNLASYDNTASEEMQQIEDKSKILNDRDAGQYRGTNGSKHVRFHRLLTNIDGRQPSDIGDSPLTGEYVTNAIESRQKGSRVDELLRVLFESNGQDIEGAKKAANDLVVDLPEGFPTVQLKEEYMDKVIQEALKLMQELANRGIKWSSRNLRVNTNIRGLNVAGELDLLLQYPDGTLEPWDFKTTQHTKGDFMPENLANYKTQVNFYNKALKDANYKSRVGGLIVIDSDTGEIHASRLEETSVENWRVEPFELRHEEDNGFSFIESVKEQLELEQKVDFEGGSTTYDLSKKISNMMRGITSSGDSEVIPPPSYTIDVKNVSRQQALDIADKTDYYEDVRWLIDKENYTPYDALKKFDLIPERVKDIPLNYKIDPDGEYINQQYENLSLEERKVLKKILDYKFEHDSSYPKGAVKYAMAPQVRGRTINKIKNTQQAGDNLAAWNVIGHNITNAFVQDADDYEFGNDLTYNGNENSMIASNEGYIRDRINRVPVLGINPIIDPNREKDLQVYKSILDLYKAIERIEDADLASLKMFEKSGKSINEKTVTEDDRQALIEDYRNRIKIIAFRNNIKNYTKENILKQQETVKKRSAGELSTEAFHSLMVYSAMSNKYKALKQIVDVAEIGSNVVRNRKVKRGNQNFRAYERWRSYVDKEFYNVQTKPIYLGELCINKIAGIVSRLASSMFLKGNVQAAIVNTGTGIIELYKESLVNQYFDSKTFNKALGIYFSYSYRADRLINGDLQDYNDDFLSLFLEKFNTQRKNESKFYDFNPERSRLIKLNPFGDKLGYLPFEEGDRLMQSVVSIAFALDTKVYDTKTNENITLFEAYRRVYKDSKEKIKRLNSDKKRKDKVFKIKSLELGDRFIKNPEDNIAINKLRVIEEALSEYQRPNNREEDTEERISKFLQRRIPADDYNWYKKNLSKTIASRYEYADRNNIKKANPLDILMEQKFNIIWSRSDEAAQEQKANEINIRLHGIYNTIDKVLFQQNVYGNAVLGMRGYVLGALERGFAGSKYNVGLKTDTDSEFASMGKLLLYLLSGAYDETGNKIDDTKRLLTVKKAIIFSNIALTHKRRAEKKYLGKQDVMSSGFSESQYYAMRRAQIHILAALTLTIAAAVLKAIAWKFDMDKDDDDDEDRSWITSVAMTILGVCHYILFRLTIEQEAYSTPEGIAKEIPSAADISPIGLKSLIRLINLASLAISGDRYQRKGAGYKQDQLKWWIQLQKMIPWWRTWLFINSPWSAEAGYLYQRNKESDYRTRTILLEGGVEKGTKYILDKKKYQKEKKTKKDKKKKKK